MAFKIRDLMINIAPGSAGEGDNPCVGMVSLKSPRCTPANAGCAEQRTDVVLCVGQRSDVALCVGYRTDLGCPGCATDRSPRSLDETGKSLEELNTLKAQLQAELAKVDEEIKQVEDSLKPKTVAEVEELQLKLKGALEELDNIKSNLEKK